MKIAASAYIDLLQICNLKILKNDAYITNCTLQTGKGGSE